MTITITGADFTAGQEYALYASDAGEALADILDKDDWTFFSATSNVITFIASGNIPQAADNIFYLSGVADDPDGGVSVNLDQGAEGTKVTVAADHTGDDTFAAGATLFTYTDEFSGEASGAFDAQIDAVNQGRLAFVGAASDAVGIDFDRADVDVQGDLDDNDTVTITLFGDMAGLGAVTFVDADGDEYEADISTNSAVVVASGGSLFAGAQEPVLEITPNGSDVMAPRTFEVSATLNLFDEGTSKVLISAADAGELDINGASARLAHISLGYGFVQWVKVTNLTEIPATIEADITVNGTTYEALPIKEVAGLSVATVSGAELEAALVADGGPATPSDASVLLTVPVGQDDVKFHAEKKDNAGRTISIIE
jgi:hypothetical protein